MSYNPPSNTARDADKFFLAIAVIIVAMMFGSLILIVIVEQWFRTWSLHVYHAHSSRIADTVIALPFLVLGYGYFYHFYQTSAQEVRHFFFIGSEQLIPRLRYNAA